MFLKWSLLNFWEEDYKAHRITESQNFRGWKGLLCIILSSPPAKTGSPRAGCTGPHSGGF